MKVLLLIMQELVNIKVHRARKFLDVRVRNIALALQSCFKTLVQRGRHAQQKLR